MWRKLPDFRAEKKAQNPVTWLSWFFFGPEKPSALAFLPVIYRSFQNPKKSQKCLPGPSGPSCLKKSRKGWKVPTNPCPIWLDDRGTGQWKWMEEVPRCTSLVPIAFPCCLRCLIGVETERLLDYEGRAGGSFPLYGGTFARSYSVSKKGTGFVYRAGAQTTLNFKDKFRVSPRTILIVFSTVDTQTAVLVSTTKAWISAPDIETPIF